MATGSAILLKEEGNRHFQAGDYVGAEGLYSKAIIADPTNPALYSNRAMARLKLSLWDSVVADCQDCLRRSSFKNTKAWYYLAQAQLALGDHDASLASACHAGDLCALQHDRSLSAVTALVLKVRKARWDERERRRVREDAELEAEVVEMLERGRDEALAALGPPAPPQQRPEGEDAPMSNDAASGQDIPEADPDADAAAGSERAEIEAEWAAKLESTKQVFERSRAAAERRRKIPDWAIDDITFAIMIDPVITKTGNSYERASIMEHLRRSATDPLTREPLRPEDLRPNLGLRQACEQFLEENGWAVDW